MLVDLGIDATNVLRRAGLPDDLFSREGAALTTHEYFRLWEAIDAEAGDPTLPIRMGEALSPEHFDPPIFAAFCSPDLNTALRRVARYKRLMLPMALHVDPQPEVTVLGIEWLDKTEPPPAALGAMELVFFVQLARLATRARVVPMRVTTPHPPTPGAAYTDYFGVGVTRRADHTLTFSSADAARPFLTANARMWDCFEPELRRRLAALDEAATMPERVRAALLELLPSGASTLEAVASKLMVSTRTLQRKLRAEEASYQSILDDTREDLARHYLRQPQITSAEISFLLGFEDPNSFFRAFRSWTGETPDRVRAALTQRD